MNTDRENNLLNTNIVYDITKFTHLDYPDHLACIIWFSGCNMRCDYCYNKDIVLAKNGSYNLHDVINFLKNRVGLLDGVVLSGGEATKHDLVELCKEIKELGYKIKLDTNGTNVKNLKLHVDIKEDVYFNADKQKIERLIDNILSNAIKYTDKKTTIDITLRPSTLSITDEGKGMSEDEISKIFERYKRFDKTQGGFGIGYSIIKSIIDEYNIKIDIQSQIKKGTKVTLKW